MLGIIIQLILSFVLLKWLQHENLHALGFVPTGKRMQQFLIGLAAPIIYFTLLFFLLAYVGQNPYQLNPHYSLSNFFHSLWYLFKSVAFETLIFQGAVFYILIKRLGVTKAVLLSAVGFGIYHWFSWHLLGQPMAMLYVFITTGLAGYLWALAFVRSGSIYLPFALHYGIDITFSILFSKDKSIGPQLFTPTYEANQYEPGILISAAGLLLYFVGFPLLTYLYLRRIKTPAHFISGQNIHTAA